MSLATGTRLDPYEILAAIGAGGMGAVYRARDTRLGRDVAIKVLPDAFAHDPERLARFRREAQILASLNHPHIAAIYGLEEAQGSQFLVLELVEGETLAARLKAGPLPVKEALNVARQVADALQAAPDGQWVGFFENLTTIRKVAISGGPAITVAALDGASRGATWLPDDTIVFATLNGTTGLQRVSASGGTPTALTRPDRTHGEADHLWPEALPGGRAVLFTIAAQGGGLDAAEIAALDLRTNTSTILVRGGSHAHYVASGHLVYAAAGTLRAVPFDLSGLTVRGPAVPVVPRLVTTSFGGGDFGVAADGTLVFVEGGVAATARSLVWVDRAGKEESIAAPPRAYVYPALSPDGTRVAVFIADQENDIWVWDLRRDTLTRLTFESGIDADPVWTPDGRRIIFSSDRGGQRNLWWQAADGTGAAERLTTSDNLQVSTGISPDGGTVWTFQMTSRRI